MKMQSGQFEALGTTIFIDIPEAFFETVFASLKLEAERIEARFSRFLPSSDLVRLNAALNQWQAVDEEFYGLLKLASKLQIQTQGALDFGVTTLLEHWGYDAAYNLKRSASVKKTETLKIDLKVGWARINTPLDFGCFGKGFFLDQAVHILQNVGVKTYLINAGGDIVNQADNLAGSQKLFLEDPRINLRVIGETYWVGFMTASSPSKRQWGDFHHLVDTQTAAPAFNMVAVYVQYKLKGIVADALSTAFFVIGFDKAISAWIDLSTIYPGIQVMFVSNTGQIWRSPQFEARLYTP